MPASRSDLFARLEALGITTKTLDHPAVFTVAESTGLERDLPGGHTKNLFLKDAKDRLFLIIAQSQTAIDLKTLHKTLGCARLSFGKPELLMEVLGVPPGSVTAFSLINDQTNRVSVIVDQQLMVHDSINCHPLENTATTNIARDDLLRFIRAGGHDPRVMALTNVPAGDSNAPPVAET
jgi:Ala-tRNA(Pro) deacylase